MRRTRALLVLAALAPLLALSSAPAPALAQGAQAQGWWWVPHRSALPAPPAPPDVGADDLLLQGGDIARALSPGTAPAPTALAALRFTTPTGADVGALVLSVAPGARAADVRAYPAAGSWSPAQGGAIEDAPEPDLSRYAPGFLSPDGSSLAFPEAGALAGEDGVLSIVLVAGVTDRVVAHRPGAGALSVTPAPEPTFSQPVGPALPPLPDTAPPVSAPAPLPVVQPVPTTAVRPVAPVVAAAPTISAQVGARRVLADDRRTRLVVAAEALLLLGFLGLLGQGPLATLGRRLGTHDPATAERGVGRFRRERVGAPPRL